MLKKCLNVRQKLGTWQTCSLDRSIARSLDHLINWSLDHLITFSISHSLTLDMLNKFRSLDRSIAQSLDRSIARSLDHSITHSGHAEQVLFSSLCSKVAVYSRKLQWGFFYSLSVILTCEFRSHRAGFQLKKWVKLLIRLSSNVRIFFRIKYAGEFLFNFPFYCGIYFSARSEYNKNRWGTKPSTER